MLDVPILLENTAKRLTKEEALKELNPGVRIASNAINDDVRWQYSYKC